MRSSFIFCLLAMYYIASAYATNCWDIWGVPCLNFCEDDQEGTKLTPKSNGTQCKKHGGHLGRCNNGQCE
uniref:Putative salivary secreted protein n=1 Tax=Ixodes ricinus TaxID=34613 RepID=A0A090XEB6_IXORI